VEVALKARESEIARLTKALDASSAAESDLAARLADAETAAQRLEAATESAKQRAMQVRVFS
jgi:septal ring factor EnvC (AmiA/AmiB activator)